MASKPTTKITARKPDANQFTTAAPRAAAKAAATGLPVGSPVRYSALPKPVAAAAKPTAARTLSHESIARKAFELYTAGTGGGEVDHWLAAERLLRAA